jgi:hypothetical protein
MHTDADTDTHAAVDREGSPELATAYDIGGQRWPKDAPGFAQAIANAHKQGLRPRCLCLAQGIEMYVARLGGPYRGFIVKRMPDTGCQHAPDGSSYEPPAELSGLGQVLGSAIAEDTATGETTLKLDFALTQLPGRSQSPPVPSNHERVATDGNRLSLRSLLHYLWDQAELTRWQPGFDSKRSWGTVRRQLLSAAEDKNARGHSLRSRLYIPEPFSVEQRDAINVRRLAQWSQAHSEPGQPQRLMLLIGEVKDIAPARYGFKAVLKHVPDQAFSLDEQLYRRLSRHFETELTLWGASDNMHLVVIATFSVSEAGVPKVCELSLMPVTQHWLPVENRVDQQLVDHLVHQRRSFRKGLRYSLPASTPVVNAILSDTGAEPCALWIARETDDEHEGRAPWASLPAPGHPPCWLWRPAEGAMPPLPEKRVHTAPGQGPAPEP